MHLPASFFWSAGIAPLGAAILVEWFFRGGYGVRRLFRHFLVREVPFRWYLLAGRLPVWLGLVQIIITGGSLSVMTLELAILALGRGILYTPIAAFEEVGWRGFALPRLQTRFNALIASLVLGFIWVVWHLPLFWLGLSGYSGMSFGWWSVEVLAVSTLVTWLFKNGRGALVVVSCGIGIGRRLVVFSTANLTIGFFAGSLDLAVGFVGSHG